jgi:hypothetical protein
MSAKHDISYRWTMSDTASAGAKAPGQPPQKVTPYGFFSDMLPGCEKYIPGAMISIDLSQSYRYPFEVLRFGHSPFPPKFPVDVAWSDVPTELADCATIGALCEKLSNLAGSGYGPKYGGLYDAFATQSEGTLATRRDLARAIFEFWDNTNYRYAVLSSGKWSPTDVFERPWDLPTAATLTESVGGAQKSVTHRIVRIPTHRPREITSPVAPGSQVLKQPDSIISMLDTDIAEIEATIGQISALLKRSRDLCDLRLRLVSGLVGLHALVAVSAGANKADNDAGAFVARLSPLPERVRRIMLSTAESDFVTARDGGAALIAHTLGPGDDLAEHIDRLAVALLEKLIGNDFGKKSGAWAKAILKQELVDHPGVQLRLGRLGQLAVGALEVVADAKSGDGYDASEKLWKILEELSDASAAVKPGDIKDRSFLDVLMIIFGKRANQGTLFTVTAGSIGNLPGYPSLTVAIVQTAAHWGLPRAAAAWKQGATGPLQTLGTRILSGFKRALVADKDLADQLDAAINASIPDQKQIGQISRDITRKIGANWQSMGAVKLGVVGLQVLAFIVAMQELKNNQSNQVTRGDKFIYVANCAAMSVQGAVLVIGGVDTMLTMLGDVHKPAAEMLGKALGFNSADTAAKQLGKAGFALGKVAALIAIITGTATVVNELSTNGWVWSRANGFTLASGALGATSGLLTLVASYVGAGELTFTVFLTASVSCPPLAALAAITAAMSVGVVTLGDEEKIERQRFNQIVLSDLEGLSRNPYFLPLLRLHPEIAKVIEDLRVKLKDGTFCMPQGGPLVRAYLGQAGFSAADVNTIVGGAEWGDPSMPLPSASSASPQ